MRKRMAWLALCWLLVAGSATAQNTKMKRAGQYLANGDYKAAIELYQPLAEKDGLPEAKIGLAQAYFRMGDFQSAAQWYGLIAGLPECTPEHKYNYALTLMRLGDCEAAQRWFGEYLRFKPYDPRKPQLLDACNQKELLENKLKGQVEIELLSFNSIYSDFAPAFYKDGLVFTSERPVENRKDGRRFTGLYLVSRQEKDGEAAYSAPEPFAGGLNSKFHEGTATFDQTQTEIYFTRTRYFESPEKPHRLEITSARRLAQGGWSDLSPLPISNDDYSVAHPSLSPDGNRLFFSSDRAGGFGGRDLYLSIFENGQWGPPINLGPSINTEGDEVFPFITNNGRLYFSSDGHFGLGGQDIFWSTEGADGFWETPENMGAPINTSFDDFSLILEPDEASGYFTSNRSGGIGGDDIYHFRKTGRLAQVDVVGLYTGEPIAGAVVANDCTSQTMTADTNGRLFIRLPQCCQLSGNAPGYQERSLEACPEEGKPASDTLFIALALEPAPQPEPFEAPAEVDFSSNPELPLTSQPSLNGMVFSEASGRPVFNAQLKLFATNCSDPMIVSTDKQGRFSIPLEADCCYQVRVERDNFFSRNIDRKVCTDPANNLEQFLNISLTPYASDPDSEGEGLPVKVTPQDGGFGFQKSMQEEGDDFAFRMNVYYDVGRSSVRQESVPELFKLLDLLKNNPDIVLEISSHTDAQGSDSFNQQLSQRRADAIVRYLASKGIQRQRLVAVGYGESRPVNGCVNDVPCTEAQYMENRRTEFRVVGKLK
ncbi:MAG: OmpA family protein [Phaeodactylibacter sp.]|nr:OmpA family protein [Phaeodactylibacter sp.]MCB9301206.1 OmpA family protein [Lewinellaceae bacterium]